MAGEHVLILGAGINGCAIARELAVNGIDVTIIDRADIASGATSYSSRLIHGGLRYLEFGEFDLVRESLEERKRLLQLAAHEVRPLELMIPVSRRRGGWRAAIAGFLGAKAPRWIGSLLRGKKAGHAERGLWLVRTGLWMYDRYARDRSLPTHRVISRKAAGAIAVDPQKFPWLCSYWDAQIRFPERFCIAMLRDAQRAAVERGSAFRLLTYHRAARRGERFELTPVDHSSDEHSDTRGQPTESCAPSLVINATGASVDRTLQAIDVSSAPLMGPTKGSHFVTFHPELIAALGAKALYAEAADGRPVFVLPLGSGVLVGTTDLPFEAPPESAVPTNDELDYLVATVNHLLPQIGLRRDDIDFYYAGVRPLPRSDATSPSGVTRRHWIAEQQADGVPVLSVIGGKLTTCRALAETVVDQVLARFGKSRTGSTRERPLHGGADAAASMDAFVAEFGLTPNCVGEVMQLFGPETGGVLKEAWSLLPDSEMLPHSNLPVLVAAWSIAHEHVQTLNDLVERRLMLLYQRTLSRACLERLADLLVERGLLAAERRDEEVVATIERLRTHFGKRVVGG